MPGYTVKSYFNAVCVQIINAYHSRAAPDEPKPAMASIQSSDYLYFDGAQYDNPIIFSSFFLILISAFLLSAPFAQRFQALLFPWPA